MRKVNVKVILDVCMQVDEGTEIKSVIDGLQFNPFLDDTIDSADILDCTIEDYEITDSR